MGCDEWLVDLVDLGESRWKWVGLAAWAPLQESVEIGVRSGLPLFFAMCCAAAAPTPTPTPTPEVPRLLDGSETDLVLASVLAPPDKPRHHGAVVYAG
jgi:hypothetical protein